MNSNRIISLVIATLIYSLFSHYTYCQVVNTDTLKPPLFKELSIIPGTNDILIKWELTDLGDIQIKKLVSTDPKYPEYLVIHTETDTSKTFFIEYGANSNYPMLYKLKTIDSNNQNSIMSHGFPTNILSYIYDSCSATINLNWTNSHTNFPQTEIVNFSNYEIWTKENSGNFNFVDSTKERNFAYKVNPNTNYTFYIAAIPEHAPDSKSTSNTVSFYSEMSQPPGYIKAQKASVSGDVVQLEFIVDPNSELTKYNLLRSTSISGPFDTIQSFQSTQKTIAMNDLDANTEKKIYYYKLAALNNCNTPVKESDTINTILLKAKNEDKINTLTWNAFNESSSAFCYYKIYRLVKGQNPLEIATLPNELTYSDNIENLSGTNAGGTICYFIIGWETPGQYLPNNSNIDCAAIEPKVFIADAFTPNGDSKNDTFKPEFTFLPNSYTLLIYNRWSNVVFESTDPQKFWDGRSLNGNPVPSGAYIYYLKIVTENNQTIEKRGNITVIYP
ncbi:MAG: hypothetical protein A2W99_06760 [Bacteroidetes bacterium GWF2_33_16]|nr:MAG: hypothetical protein A2X00_06885 [Bacteroidetes bacterium GWE2_32_14]OFY02756.1 MAG: hypothetical protein A2W99_06760 [Bacteroidetes bacterium GWF2_33_16]